MYEKDYGTLLPLLSVNCAYSNVTSGTFPPPTEWNEIKKHFKQNFSVLFLNISVISADQLFSSFENKYFDILVLPEKYQLFVYV